jgi:hypothetical protein
MLSMFLEKKIIILRPIENLCFILIIKIQCNLLSSIFNVNLYGAFFSFSHCKFLLHHNIIYKNPTNSHTFFTALYKIKRKRDH